MRHLIFALSLVAIPLLVLQAKLISADHPKSDPDGYADAIRKTAQMVSDSKVSALAVKHGLNVLNVAWEDTGRFKGSAVGPNISDMTIQVAHRDPKTDKLDVTCMPVIRKPNFSDKTCDLDPRDFTLLVGNHEKKDGELKRISLYDFLEQPTRYLNKPGSWCERFFTWVPCSRLWKKGRLPSEGMLTQSRLLSLSTGVSMFKVAR